MKLLITIPVFTNQHVLDECMSQIMYKKDVTIIILDNNSDQEVKDRLEFYKEYANITVWKNEVNEFVVKPWDSFIKYFLDNPQFDRLIILNSDLTLAPSWWENTLKIFTEHPEWTLVPKLSNCKETVLRKSEPLQHVYEIAEGGMGVPGVFVTLSREQALMVFPLPFEHIKVWFSDTYIYSILSATNYPVVICSDILAFHHTSSSIKGNKEIYAIIEEDKIAWEEIVRPELNKKIKLYN